MTGHLPIAALAWLFGLATLFFVALALYRLRHWPITWLLAAQERQATFHREALAALDSAIAAAGAEGRSGEAERLAPYRAGHIRALADIAAMRPFAGER